MNSDIPDNWIDLAAAHGTTRWVKQFIRSYLPQLANKSLSEEELAQAIDEELQSRCLNSPAQQKNYRSNLVQALKVIDKGHPAIALVSPTTEEYRELNEAQKSKLADRETRYLTSAQAEELVERATALLDSSEWSDVGAGLSVLIGRRISEILLSKFLLKSTWSINFSEMAKKENEQRVIIEIPTLVPAQKAVAAIERLQRSLKIQDLKLASLSPKMAKQTVNQRYSGAIAAKCEKHFSDLVPTRSDKDNLYTHVFRAVYATIAAHWFCPVNVPEHIFKAEIQGHFTVGTEGQKLPNFSARANYDDYAILDECENKDGRLGVKLGILPEIQVIEVFRKPHREMILPTTNATSQHDRDDPTGNRSLADDSLPTALSKPIANAIRYRAAGLLAKTNPAPAEQSVALQLLSGLSAQQLAQADISSIAPFEISVDGKTVLTLVQQLMPYIRDLRRSPPPSLQEVQKVCEETFEGLPIQHEFLADVYPLLAAHQNIPTSSTRPEPSIMPETQTPKIKCPELYADDLDRMTSVMAKQGITGSTAEVFHALIEAFELKQPQQQHQQGQTIGNIAQTLNWFIKEIDTLRSQVKHLERDLLKSDPSVAEELKRLQVENDVLKGELHQTQSKMESIQKLLSMGAGEQEQIQESQAIALTKSWDTSAASSVGTKQRQQTSRKSPVRRSREETTAKINQIIDALIAWNASQEDSKRQLRISIPIIKELASPLNANYQPVIQDVLKEREPELDAHHRQWMLGVRHNATVSMKSDILESIALQLRPSD